jgi:protocatechuate 3,4-dioxygenase beta subunit
MKHDDQQVGRVLSRREALGLLGWSGAAVLGTGSSLEAITRPPFRLPACIVRPSQAEGPYFVDTKLERSDIRSDPTDGSVCEGAPLQLTVQVSQLNATGCHPLAAALVDVWQCDAMGIYSGVEDINGMFNTVGKQFLRGHQITDAAGIARFQTIYPGWYPGRTVHIHFKIRTNPSAETGHEFTSQLYFEDSLTDRLLARQPYAKTEGERPRNQDDRIYRSGGDQLLLDVREDGEGYAATFDIGLQID